MKYLASFGAILAEFIGSPNALSVYSRFNGIYFLSELMFLYVRSYQLNIFFFQVLSYHSKFFFRTKISKYVHMQRFPIMYVLILYVAYIGTYFNTILYVRTLVLDTTYAKAQYMKYVCTYAQVLENSQVCAITYIISLISLCMQLFLSYQCLINFDFWILQQVIRFFFVICSINLFDVLYFFFFRCIVLASILQYDS